MNRTILETKPMKTIDYREAKKSDDPKTFVEGYARLVAENAAIISKAPFLLPLGLDGKVKNYDFSYTEADMVPKGWKGLVLDLSQELMDYFGKTGIDPYTFHINQLKEKFGSIRLYYSLLGGNFEEDDHIDEIIGKYEELSEHTCCECGGEATLMSRGWICPYCQSCADKLKAEEEKNWNFDPLEKSAWTKIGDSQSFARKETKEDTKK